MVGNSNTACEIKGKSLEGDYFASKLTLQQIYAVLDYTVDCSRNGYRSFDNDTIHQLSFLR